MQIYAVCFDISDDKSRTRVAKLLMEYGHRQQLSVFEIAVKSPVLLEGLKNKISHHLDHGDKVTFYRLCKDCRHKSFNQDESPVAHFPAAIVM